MMSGQAEVSHRYEELQRTIAERDRKLGIEAEKIEGLKDHIGTLKEKIKGHDEAKKELENRLQAQIYELVDKNASLTKQLQVREERLMSGQAEVSQRYEEFQRTIAEKDRKLGIEAEKIEGLKDHIGTLKDKIKAADESKKELEGRLQA